MWDKLLGLNLFPAERARKEIAFYLKHLNRYGLPLDNRKDYTKLDWELWTATLADKPDEFEQFMTPLAQFGERVAEPRAADRLVRHEDRQAGGLPGAVGGRRPVREGVCRSGAHQEVARHGEAGEIGPLDKLQFF